MNAEDAEARAASRAAWVDAIPLGVFAGFAWGFALLFSRLSFILQNAYVSYVGITVLGFGTPTGALWTSTIIAVIGTTAFALYLRWRAAKGKPWLAPATGFAGGIAVGIALILLVAALPIAPGLEPLFRFVP